MTEQPSSPNLLGPNFPFVLDGKSLLLRLAGQFASEVNTAAKTQASDRWIDIVVRSAYPTLRQDCPRIVVQRVGTSSKLAGLGAEIDVVETDGLKFKHTRGNHATDNIALSICTHNELLRDHLYVWLQQYILDAQTSVIRDSNVWDLRVTNAQDNEIEFKGGQGQPGFQFYVAELSVTVGYDQVVFADVDRIGSIVNWQLLCTDINDQIKKPSKQATE